ncbi:MAG: DNA recombination protein RmuC [Phycisphaeraceae bacterium]|nr:DNA recombination protein RmuC [Phycisphaeraceae bacterium]MCW5762025.1 DNA recombination protein RmuC [Phycisphaeraceae bacterium]
MPVEASWLCVGLFWTQYSDFGRDRSAEVRYTPSMTMLAWIFLIVAAGLAVVVAYLVSGRARLFAQHASDRASAESLERALAESRSELDRARATEEQARDRIVELSKECAMLRERLENAELLRQELERHEQRLRESFAALSNEALKSSLASSREEFLAHAKPYFDAARQEHANLVRPIGETLEKTRERLESIERARAESFAALGKHIEMVSGASEGLRNETERLTRALSRPEVRGQYGEIQLRRVAELAGMVSYCDFTEQTSSRDGEGNLLRPDMVVRLPNERVIAVDAKTNTYAYLEAVNARDEAEREKHLDRFAGHVQDQTKKLSDKRYWAQFDGAPEFVVMFVPGDHFIDAALARQPDLLETAAQRNVILASPSTLIGLLRAVAVGWREHRLAEEAQALLRLGAELHDRAATTFEHARKLGDSIRQSVDRYNSLVGSIDQRMLPTLRKFEDGGARSPKTLPELSGVEVQPRTLQAGE